MGKSRLLIISCAGCCSVLLALLVANAANVQGASPNLAIAGGAVGLVLGLAFMAGKASLRFLGVVLGSVAGLQFFQCLPCDGSHIVMPTFGAMVFGGAGWIVQLAIRKCSPGNKPILKG